MKKKSTQFDKFTKKKSNAAIKEEFRQEKRKWKKEREDFFDKKRTEAGGGRQSAGGFGDREVHRERQEVPQVRRSDRQLFDELQGPSRPSGVEMPRAIQNVVAPSARMSSSATEPA